MVGCETAKDRHGYINYLLSLDIYKTKYQNIEVVEFEGGTHEALLLQGGQGLYRTLWEKQQGRA